MNRNRNVVFLLLLAASLAGCMAGVDKAPVDPAEDDAEITAAESGADSARRPTVVGEVQSGEAVDASFSSSSRYLAWYFDAQAGDTIELWAHGVSPSDLDTVLFLYRGTSSGRPTGASIAMNDDVDYDLSSYLSFEAPESRRYVALVRRYDRGTSGTVALTLQLTSAAGQCGAGQQACSVCGVETRCYSADTPCPEFLCPPPSGCGPGQQACSVCGVETRCYSADTPCPEFLCPPPSQACGGLRGLTCPSGQFCNYSTDAMCGAADQTGTCQPVPDVCAAVVDPVCGCDGRTYNSTCDANRAGVSAASTGECAPRDCRTTGCGAGQYCTYCWVGYSCIPNGALC